ncbi:hypothetical protein CEXT_533861 [Caerostris extrusa]|uniref:Uncharacterized protein n=1 Tax=Caerostris extrusa TaxID=172846 RepID=A0AAV4MZS8_CAEEX|nr:hypothetical protein CEXT_533861 [Caerostris extrusa]
MPAPNKLHLSSDPSTSKPNIQRCTIPEETVRMIWPQPDHTDIPGPPMLICVQCRAKTEPAKSQQRQAWRPVA